MTFRIVLLTKWAHFESILSIENIWKCLEYKLFWVLYGIQNELISGKLEYTLLKTKSSDRFFGYYTDV